MDLDFGIVLEEKNTRAEFSTTDLDISGHYREGKNSVETLCCCQFQVR